MINATILFYFIQRSIDKGVWSNIYVLGLVQLCLPVMYNDLAVVVFKNFNALLKDVSKILCIIFRNT